MVVAAWSTTQTSTATTSAAIRATITASGTVADEPALDVPPPLSDEDLALIEAIAAEDVAPTRTATPARAGPLLMVDLGRDRIRAVVPRTVGEALLAEPTSLVARRHHVAGDDLIVRGRAGPRLDVRLDGQPLTHALTRFDEHAELGILDPWMLEHITVGGMDRVALTSVMPRTGAHVDTFAAIPVRSADRSSGVEAQAEGGVGPVGLALMGGYADFGRLRTDGSHDAAPWPYQRANLRARAQAFGAKDDPVALTAGFDVDRLTNVEVRRFREEQRLRTAGFLDGKLRLGFGDVELSGGVQDYRIERKGGLVDRVSVIDTKARLVLRVERRELAVDGAFTLSDAGAAGSQYTGTAGGSLRLHLKSVEARADIHWVRARVVTGDVPHLADGLTSDGKLVVWLGDELAIAGAWSYAFRMPTVADAVLLARDDILPERSVLGELGPSWVVDTADLALSGWVRWIDRAIEPLPGGQATYVEDVVLGGADLRAGWRPIAHLKLSGAAGFTASDRVLAGIPGLVLAAAARWESSPEGWNVELHARAHVSIADPSPAETPPPTTLSRPERGEWDGLTLGLRGWVPIGAGFAVTLGLENALDRRSRGYGGAINEPGVDFTAALSHAY